MSGLQGDMATAETLVRPGVGSSGTPAYSMTDYDLISLRKWLSSVATDRASVFTLGPMEPAFSVISGILLVACEKRSLAPWPASTAESFSVYSSVVIDGCSRFSLSPGLSFPTIWVFAPPDGLSASSSLSFSNGLPCTDPSSEPGEGRS